jgi:putative ABC transport system permease protein
MFRSRAFRNVQLGVKNLLLHAMRSMLTMLGIVFGVGSVIAMLSVGEGASKEALDQIRMLGSSNIMIESMKPVSESSGPRRGRMSIYGLKYADVRRIEQIPHVRRIVPAKVVKQDGRLKERSMELRIVGTTPEWFELVNREMLAGRALSERDIEGNSAVCVLTEHGARKLLATENTIGQRIRVRQGNLKVVGIVRTESSGGSVQTPDQLVDAYAPINVIHAMYGDIVVQHDQGSRSREYIELHQIIVEVDSTEHVESVSRAIEAALRRYHPKTDYKINIPLALLRQAEKTKQTFNIVLGSIAGISLLVGGIGIMNIMLATVTERTREIGIRRAIGAKRSQIVMQFLIETTVLTMIGGLIGIVFGVVIPMLVTRFAGMPTVVTPWSIILSLGISVAVGIIFGLYPAVRAAKLDPIVALRHE